jgi:hypothetical protein
MTEISQGVSEISIAMEQVTQRNTDLRDAVATLNAEIGRFRTEQEES